MIARALLPVVVLAAVLAPAGTTAGPAVFAGTITFAGAEPSGIGLRPAGNTVTITLGPGHVAQAQVAAAAREGNAAVRRPGPAETARLRAAPEGRPPYRHGDAGLGEGGRHA